MPTSRQTDLTYVRDLYRTNCHAHAEHLERAGAIADPEVSWSDSYFDFYPFEGVLNSPYSGAKKKKQQDGVIENRAIGGRIFHSRHVERLEWGSAFFENSDDRTVRLLYVGDNSEPETMVLHQVHVVFFQNASTDRVLFYMKDREKETFMQDTYSYDGRSVLKEIVRRGFWESPKNAMADRTFTFDIAIYSRQRLPDGTEPTNLLYPKTKT